MIEIHQPTVNRLRKIFNEVGPVEYESYTRNAFRMYMDCTETILERQEYINLAIIQQYERGKRK